MNEKAREKLTVDQFEVLRELGQGGTSAVYLVTDPGDGKLCAMKALRKDLAEGTPEILRGRMKQLQSEAAVLEALGKGGREGGGNFHPGIPAYCGEILDEEGAFAGFLMEYVEGKSLMELLEEGHVYSVRETAEAGLQLCSIMEFLHRKDPPVIYRDLKPSNIVVRPDGNLVVVDFGAVRKYRKSAASDTSHLGTEGYAAPEQYGGWEQSDERTDIYGIGAVLHHMITGRPPLDTGLRPLGEILNAADTGRLTRQCSEIAKILCRCCMTAPSMRYSSCGELEKALRGVLRTCAKAEASQARMKAAERRAGRRTEILWKKFIALACAGLAFLVCGGAFTVLSSEAGKREYRDLIAQAGEIQDPEKKARAYRRAVEARPEEAEAYISFVRDLARDCVITQEEKETLDTVLYAKGSLDRMRESRPGEYTEVEMQLGKAYFACYEGGTEAVSACFRNALETAGLWFGERRSAEAMAVVLGEEWTAARIDAWRTLELEAVREAEETGGGVFAAAVCKAAAAEIALLGDRYEEMGTDREKMKEVTGYAERFMTELESGRIQVPQKLRGELRTAVESALRGEERQERKAAGEPERKQVGEAE